MAEQLVDTSQGLEQLPESSRANLMTKDVREFSIHWLESRLREQVCYQDPSVFCIRSIEGACNGRQTR
jgi:hypothetical protein